MFRPGPSLHSVGSPPNCIDKGLPVRRWRLRGLYANLRASSRQIRPSGSRTHSKPSATPQKRMELERAGWRTQVEQQQAEMQALQAVLARTRREAGGKTQCVSLSFRCPFAVLSRV